MISLFSKLHPDIITCHILPRLDGETLIILSSVSSQFRHWICNNNSSYLWRNVCTTTWPSLFFDYPFHNLFEVISYFPGGYRGFFSDAFPSIHPLDIPDALIHLIRRSTSFKDTFFHYAIDIVLHDEPQPKPLISVNTFEPILKEEFKCTLEHTISNKNFIPVKKEGFAEYLEEKLTLSCVVIDPHGRRAASSFSFGHKPVLVTRYINEDILVVYETELPGVSSSNTQMVKCLVEVICAWDGEGEDRFHVNNDVYITIKDMNGIHVRDWDGAVTILNAIGNAQRKKNQNNY